MVSSLLYPALAALGIPHAARLVSRDGTILCYHNVVSDDEPGASTNSLHMSLARFERQVRWLSEHYELIPLREFVARFVRRQSLRRLAALTFDDGYVGVFRNALPLLAKFKVPATVFVIANAPGRRTAFWWDHPDLPPDGSTGRISPLDDLRGDQAAIEHAIGLRSSPAISESRQPAPWADIVAAARAGVDIGVHSTTHRCLPSLTDQELDEEISASRRIVERAVGIPVDFFAYPYGRWNARVRDAVRAAGYRGAVTLDAGLNSSGTDPWSLRRINIPAGISDAAFSAWTAGVNPRWALR